MKKTMVSIVAVILMATVLMGLSGQASASPAPSGVMAVTGVSWFSDNSTQLAVPGMNEVPLFLTFENSIPMTNLSVSVNLTASAPGAFSYSYIIGPNKPVNEVYTIPALPAGTSTTIEQTVNISSSAPNGIYVENLTFSYGNSTAMYYGNVSFNLPLAGDVNVVSPSAFFGTQSTPLAGTPGMTNVPITVMLENTGNSAATNVSVSYTPTGSLSGSTQNTVLSAIPAYGAVPVTFMVSVADNASISQVYGQNLSVSYYGAAHRVPFNLPKTGSSNISIINYFTNPPVIYQGEKFVTLTVVTENSGSSFAKNVGVSVSSSRFDVMSNPYNLSYFPSGAVENFTFLLNAKNYTGTANIQVTLGKYVQNLTLTLHSYGSFGISANVPDLHTGVDKQLLSFNITNTGEQTLYDFTLHLLSPSVVSLHIPSSNPLAALTETNVTFSEIKPGQTVTATFLVDTSSSAAFATYPAQLAISWRLNNSVNPFYQTYNFNEKVTPTGIQNIQGMFTFTPLNIAVLVLIIALIIGLVALAGRGRKLKRETEKLRSRENREEYKQLPHKQTAGNDQISRVIQGADEENNRGK